MLHLDRVRNTALDMAPFLKQKKFIVLNSVIKILKIKLDMNTRYPAGSATKKFSLLENFIRVCNIIKKDFFQ